MQDLGFRVIFRVQGLGLNVDEEAGLRVQGLKMSCQSTIGVQGLSFYIIYIYRGWA